MFPQLSVIIVSYNTKKLTLDCLKSVYQQKHIEFEVIVVDNNSSDGSVAAIKKNFPQVRLIANKKNTGFARANNQAIGQARGQYYLLLNSDTQVHPDCFVTLYDYMQANHIVGIASPQIKNPDGSIQVQGGALPNLLNIFLWQFHLNWFPLFPPLIKPYHQSHPHFFTKTRPTGWVSGTAMFIRKFTLEDIGILDEKIFMYSEDTDLCIRAKQDHYQVHINADASVTHLSHASGSHQKAILGEYQGLIHLWKKHQPTWQLPLLKLILRWGARLRAVTFGTIVKDKTRYETYQQAISLVR